MSFLGKNFDIKNDDRFNVLNSRKILKKDVSIIGYDQPINSGSQATIAGVRTQLLNDGQGTGSYSTAVLWNPINNRINLQDAQIGDFIDINIILASVSTGGIFQFPLELDYSPLLDGSQVVTNPITRLALVTAGNMVALDYEIKFVITQEMKENGIGVMVTPFASYTLVNTYFSIVRLKIPT